LAFRSFELISIHAHVWRQSIQDQPLRTNRGGTADAPRRGVRGTERARSAPAPEPVAAERRERVAADDHAVRAVDAESGVLADEHRGHEGRRAHAGEQVHGGLACLLLGHEGLVGRVHLGPDVAAEVLHRQVDGLREDELRDREVDREGDPDADVELADLLPVRALGGRGARADLAVLDVVADGRGRLERVADQAAHELVGLGADLLRLGEEQGRGLVEHDAERPVGERDGDGVAVGAVRAVHGAGHGGSFPHLACSLLRLIRIDEG